MKRLKIALAPMCIPSDIVKDTVIIIFYGSSARQCMKFAA